MPYADLVRAAYRQEDRQRKQQQALDKVVESLQANLVQKDYVIIALQTRLRHLLLTKVGELSDDDLDMPDTMLADGVRSGLYDLPREQIATIAMKKEALVQGLLRHVYRLKQANERLRLQAQRACSVVGQPKTPSWAGIVPALVPPDLAGHQLSPDDGNGDDDDSDTGGGYNVSTDDEQSVGHSQQDIPTAETRSRRLLQSSSYIVGLCSTAPPVSPPRVTASIPPRSFKALRQQHQVMEHECNTLRAELAKHRTTEQRMEMTIRDLRSQVQRLRSVLDK
ncbi:hypothetical protein RI367_004286 [Sorochytrium milnesiophthora]